MRRKLVFSVILIVIALLFSACGSLGDSPPPPSPYGNYEIDPVFWAYFKQHGGTDQFGEVITTVFSNTAGEKLQFVKSGLLVYTPAEDRFYFAPLGTTLKLGEPPEPRTPEPGDLILNNYLVHPALVNFYLEMGRELVGAPITNPHYNYSKNRLEQHFENLGLYYLLDDPDKTPHLLSYGLLACTSCQAYAPYPDLDPGGMGYPVTDALFDHYIQSNGLLQEVLGDVIEGPTLLSDGSTELVFEHLVLSASDGKISTQEVPQALGFSTNQLFEQIQSPLLVFVPLQDNLGHNVLILFHRFILNHGGYEIFGAPTTELFSLDYETITVRQCFSYLCLDYNPDALEAQVRPAKLGLDYLKRSNNQYPIPDPIIDPTADSTSPRAPFTLYAWESNSAINSETSQTISAMVFSQGVAQAGQNLELYLTLPEGTELLYYLPTTNSEGRSGISIQPIEGENGTLILYQVCLPIEGQESICVQHSYMIWGNP
ncbi:MAG: hypothetical protein ABFS17_00790 [Chloroflexota bacterium]